MKKGKRCHGSAAGGSCIDCIESIVCGALLLDKAGFAGAGLFPAEAGGEFTKRILRFSSSAPCGRIRRRMCPHTF